MLADSLTTKELRTSIFTNEHTFLFFAQAKDQCRLGLSESSEFWFAHGGTDWGWKRMLEVLDAEKRYLLDELELVSEVSRLGVFERQTFKEFNLIWLYFLRLFMSDAHKTRRLELERLEVGGQMLLRSLVQRKPGARFPQHLKISPNLFVLDGPGVEDVEKAGWDGGSWDGGSWNREKHTFIKGAVSPPLWFLLCEALLSRNSRVRSIDLSCKRLLPFIGLISDANPEIVSLTLRVCDVFRFEGSGMRLLGLNARDCLSEAGGWSLRNLCQLCLHGTMDSLQTPVDSFVQALCLLIKSSTKLQCLRVANCKGGSLLVTQICHALVNNKTMKELTLKNLNWLDLPIHSVRLNLKPDGKNYQGVAALAALFGLNKTLEKVDVSQNLVTTKALKLLCEGLEKKSLNLTQVDLGFSPFESFRELDLWLAELGGAQTLLNVNALVVFSTTRFKKGVAFEHPRLADSRTMRLQRAVSLRSAWLDKLVLSGVGLGNKGALSLAQGLETCASLRYFDLSRNRLEKEGPILALTRSLVKSRAVLKLRTVLLHTNLLQNQGVHALCECLLPQCAKLEHVSLAGNQVDSRLASGLDHLLANNLCPSLGKIDLSRNQMCGVGFFQSLATNCSLLDLQIQNSGLVSNQYISLGRALQTNCMLRTLNLANNKVGDAGIAALASALRCHNPPLQSLDLSSNFVGSKGLSVLAHALAENTNLNILKLARNEVCFNHATYSTDFHGLHHFVQALSRRTTQVFSLDLNFNSLGLNGAKKLLILFKTNPKIIKCTFRGNNLDEKISRKLSRALARNQSRSLQNLEYVLMSPPDFTHFLQKPEETPLPAQDLAPFFDHENEPGLNFSHRMSDSKLADSKKFSSRNDDSDSNLTNSVYRHKAPSKVGKASTKSFKLELSEMDLDFGQSFADRYDVNHFVHRADWETSMQDFADRYLAELGQSREDFEKSKFNASTGVSLLKKTQESKADPNLECLLEIAASVSKAGEV